MVKRKNVIISKEDKINLAVENPLFESKNKQYGKIKHNGKITYISIDKNNPTQQKQLSAKQFRNLRKITKIKESYNKLTNAFERTNQNTNEGMKTENKIYKKYKDEKGKTRYLQLDKNTKEIEKTYSYKQALNIFRKFKKEKDINVIKMTKGISKKEATEEYHKKQVYLKENQIKGIMKKEDKTRTEATKEWNRLYKLGRNDILIGRYTTFNPDSSYEVIT